MSVYKVFVHLVIALILLVSCEVTYDIPVDEFEEILIREGDHGASPYFYSYEYRDSFRVQFVFTSSSPYNLEDEDQKDWNKLIGLSFHYLDNEKNSAMVAWRWGIECQCNELTAYYHIDGARAVAFRDPALPGHDQQVLATTGELGSVKNRFILHPDGRVTVGINDVSHTVQFAPDLAASRTRVINTWFGGNRVAPHDIYFLRKLY